MADQSVQPPFPDAPPEPTLDEELEAEPGRPRDAHRRSRADAALPWALAAVVVLLLAASAGLIGAWIVANMHAVPGPLAVDVTPSPTALLSTAPSTGPTSEPTDQPLHTPSPSPERTQEPEPFIHVVQRGETLTYIADLYGVTLEDIVALNDIKNPDRIHEGRELLIPGYGIRPSPSPG